jgi:hypothetical protein
VFKKFEAPVGPFICRLKTKSYFQYIYAILVVYSTEIVYVVVIMGTF